MGATPGSDNRGEMVQPFLVEHGKVKRPVFRLAAALPDPPWPTSTLAVGVHAEAVELAQSREVRQRGFGLVGRMTGIGRRIPTFFGILVIFRIFSPFLTILPLFSAFLVTPMFPALSATCGPAPAYAPAPGITPARKRLQWRWAAIIAGANAAAKTAADAAAKTAAEGAGIALFIRLVHGGVNGPGYAPCRGNGKGDWAGHLEGVVTVFENEFRKGVGGQGVGEGRGEVCEEVLDGSRGEKGGEEAIGGEEGAGVKRRGTKEGWRGGGGGVGGLRRSS